MSIGAIWDLIILSPMVNILIVLSQYLFNSFGLTIIVLTVVIRAVMYPLTIKQVQATKAMQTLQPKLAELNKKYANDKQQLAQEQLRLYKESGVSTAGCALPMLIQLPIWLALYQSIVRVLAVAPEDFLNLSRHLYSSWTVVFSLVPLESRFLWLDLSVPDRWMILSILVFVTMWVQQKMTMSSTGDPRQQQQAQMMLWMMPMMFSILTLSFPSGLALYWVVSNIISIVMQYHVTGWEGLISPTQGKKSPKDKKIRGRVNRQASTGGADITGDRTTADIVETKTTREEGSTDEESRDKRQDRGGSDSASLRPTRRKPGRGKGHHPKGG
ncbi:MAG: YidC/Oxa1 family membrane protein insertase [Dehalococcoidales bacterium]|nr:YidC/Oxa1 family membrane protein insertase [Dehalococcoidales bacterium]